MTDSIVHAPSAQDSWDKHLESINSGLKGVYSNIIEQLRYDGVSDMFSANLSNPTCPTTEKRTKLGKTKSRTREFRLTALECVEAIRRTMAYKQ